MAQATDNLVFDFAEMRKLASLLETEGKEIPALLKSTHDDVDALAKTWAGTNHDRFVTYFEDVYGDVTEFDHYVAYYGELLSGVIKIYERLEADIDARVHGATRSSGGSSSGQGISAGYSAPPAGSGNGGAHPSVSSSSGSGGSGGTVYTTNPADSVRPDMHKG